MKKKVWVIVALILLVGVGIGFKVFAKSEPTVNFSIDGEFKEGNTVDLILEVKDVDRLYGAQMDFTYNPEYIKVNSITKGELFNTIENDPFESDNINKDGQVAQYICTYTGDVYGLKGSGDLLKVNLTVLKDGKLDISESNMAVILVERKQGEQPEYMEFKQNNLTIGKGTEIPTL